MLYIAVAYQFAHLNAQPPFRQIVYIGVRDVDRGEREIIYEHGIQVYSMQHVDRWGVAAATIPVRQWIDIYDGHCTETALVESLSAH